MFIYSVLLPESLVFLNICFPSQVVSVEKISSH